MTEETTIKAGFSSVDITPPVGTEMSGYGFFLNRKATRIGSPLYARALVLDQGETRVAIITADLLAVNAEITAKTRAAVEALTGIPGENVLIACSHTHSGPATIFLHGCGEVDSEYVALLPRLFATAVSEAVSWLAPVRVAAGKIDLLGLAKNRVDPNGKVDTAVQVLEFVRHRNIARHAIFSFGCHPVHTLNTDTVINDEFTGRACRILANQTDYYTALFLPGSSGDINPVTAHTNPDEMARASRMLAGAALTALAQATEVQNLTPLRCLRRTVELPLAVPPPEELQQQRDHYRNALESLPVDSAETRNARFRAESAENLLMQLTGESDPWLEILRDAQQTVQTRTGREPRLNELAQEMDLPPDSVLNLLNLQKEHAASGHQVAQTLACELQAIQMGDIVFLAHPTELFAEFGLEIRERSPFPHTFVVGYANDFLGYLPNEAEFARQGYAAATVPYMLGVFPYTPNVARVFVEACVGLLNDLQ